VTTKPLLDLQNTLNWDAIFRGGMTRPTAPNGSPMKDARGRIIPIKDAIFTVKAQRFLVGTINPESPANWRLGCRAMPRLPVVPTSFQPQFPNLIDAEEKPFYVPLNRFKMLTIPDYGVGDYALALTFPFWHENLYVEIWQYSGLESDTVEQSLLTANQALVSINQKIEEFQNQTQINNQGLDPGGFI